MAFARAVQGSNSIEGYNASLDDVAAAVEGEPTLDANLETQLALAGYRDAMTYVLQVAEDEDAAIDEGVIKALHFMMLKHDLSKSPGRWRPGYIGVRNDTTGQIVYEGPDADSVGELSTRCWTRSARTMLPRWSERRSRIQPRDDPSLPRWQRAHGQMPAGARNRARSNQRAGVLERRGVPRA